MLLKREQTKGMKVFWVALLYLVACIWIAPHGFDPTDGGALLVQYSAPLDAAKPVGLGTFLTVWIGHAIYVLLPSHQLLCLSLLAWLLFGVEAVMVYQIIVPFAPAVLSASLAVGGVFMNKFFDLLGYNNWSIFFFILLLFCAVKGLRSTNLFWLFLAGCMVGISTGFRLPNLLQGTMVLGVFWHQWHSRSFKKAWGPSLMFCLGVFLSLAAVWGSYGAFYGMDALWTFGPKYLGKLDSNTGIGYSAAEMLLALVKGLGKGLLLLLPACVLLLAFSAGLFFFFSKRSSQNKWAFINVVAGLLAAALFFFYLNVFSEDWLSARRPSLCAIAVFCLLVCLGAAFALMHTDPDLSTLCVFGVGMILIVTLGTNNGDLFFMMGMTYYVPVTAAALIRLKMFFCPEPNSWRCLCATLVQRCGCLVFLALALFNFFTYEYQDGRITTTTAQVNIPQLAGMKTTSERSAMYEEFMEISAAYQDEPFLIYGSFPIGYCLSGAEPAVEQVWPDLDSYSRQQLAAALQELEQEQRWPLIVFAYTWGPDYRYAPEKWADIENFAIKNAYQVVYRSERFLVYSKENAQ